jgi:hypothetical protein
MSEQKTHPDTTILSGDQVLASANTIMTTSNPEGQILTAFTLHVAIGISEEFRRKLARDSWCQGFSASIGERPLQDLNGNLYYVITFVKK